MKWLLGLILLAGNTLAQEREGWRLIWSDEFNGSGALDSAKWSHEEGFIRNNEEQYYTKADIRNASRKNGILAITARKENKKNPSHTPGAPENAFFGKHRETITCTSASVITEGKFSFLYGRLEVRARLPKGQGVWPAIWMMGANRKETGWPRCGEIDVMEFVWSTRETAYGTVHWYKPGEKKNHASKGGTVKSGTLSTEFHIYAIEWDKDKIDFFFDDQKYFTYAVALADQPDGSNPFRLPQYLLMNLAIGGSWGGAVAEGTLPATCEIDYVRIYQKGDEAPAKR